MNKARWLLPLLTLAALPASAQEDPRWEEGPLGPFRVAFDPGNRAWMGLGLGLGGEITPLFELGVSVRSPSKWDPSVGQDALLWEIQLLNTSAELTQGTWGLPAVEATLAQATLVAFSSEPWLTLPGGGRRVRFPFSVGFTGRALSLDTHDPLEAQVEVARAAVVLDPLRSGRPDRWVHLSVGIDYDLYIQPEAQAPLAGATWTLAPFTAGALAAHFESNDGLWLLDGLWEVTPALDAQGSWRVDSLARVRAERTVLAIQDQPITPWLAVSTHGRGVAPEQAQVQLGIRVGFEPTSRASLPAPK